MRPTTNPTAVPALNRRGTIALLLSALSVGVSTALMAPVWLSPPSYPHVRAEAPDAAPSRDIVVDLRDDATTADVQGLDARYGLDLEPNSIEFSANKLMRAAVAAGQDENALLDQLRQNPLVEAAEPELQLSLPEQGQSWRFEADDSAAPGTADSGITKGRYVPNDPRYREQWDMQMIGAEQAWTRTRGKGIVVAVIDTGVAGGKSKRGQAAKDLRQTRFVPGYDFIHNDDDPYDDHGHGTHVAGTVAEATNNKEGVAGLAFEAAIMPIKVLTAEGFGTSSGVADGIRFAADHGANVINMSLGGMSPSEVIHDAVQHAAKKGVVIVCAAGNGFGEGVAYPAAYPECIAVSSVGPTGDLAFYSSYGKEVTLAAPGGDMQRGGMAGGILQNSILSEEIGGRGDDYYFFQGTSMAAPHVAAAAALLMADGTRDRERVRQLLIKSAQPKKPALKYGAGILSVGKATSTLGWTHWVTNWKRFIFLFTAGLILVRRRKLPVWMRCVLVLSLWIGFFGPEQAMAMAGTNSPWNLLTASALVPFALFWEFEKGLGSKLVSALALGVAGCLAWALLAGTLPFTAAGFGTRVILWAATNIMTALFLAGLAWLRGQTD